jgi:hypothetical protein
VTSFRAQFEDLIEEQDQSQHIPFGQPSHLAFPDHVHDFISLDRPPVPLKDRNPWLALTRRLIAMILFHYVVQVRTGTTATVVLQSCQHELGHRPDILQGMRKSRPPLFKWRHFEPAAAVITCAVGWYLRFSLTTAVSGVAEGKEQFKEFMRRVRKAVGTNDKSASHATRVAGTENFKEKYAPAFPVVTILESYPGRVMTPEQLQAMDLLAAPEPIQATTLQFIKRAETRSGKGREWPSYDMSLAGAPRTSDGSGPDRSKADFWWCKLAIQRKWSIEDTEARLLEVSEKARERVRLGDTGYVHQTVLNAAMAVERDRQRSRA